MRQTLINSEAPISRMINKQICTIFRHLANQSTSLLNPFQRPIDREKPELASPNTIIVPQQRVPWSQQQQAFNEPGPRPSSHCSKVSLASRFGSSSFTVALPATVQVCSRASSFCFQMLTQGGLRLATPVLPNNSQVKSPKAGILQVLKSLKDIVKTLDVNATM